MAKCFNTACPYCTDYQCKRTCTCDMRLDGEYVKIVRCKDCVYWRYDDCQNNNHGYCPTNENDFCPWGERKYEVEVVHYENCKYEDTHGGMTNREYLATLSNEELSNVIYDVIVDRIGYRYNSSKLGVAQWLGELYREDDFKKRLTYTVTVPYVDNKKIKDGGEND